MAGRPDHPVQGLQAHVAAEGAQPSAGIQNQAHSQFVDAGHGSRVPVGGNDIENVQVLSAVKDPPCLEQPSSVNSRPLSCARHHPQACTIGPPGFASKCLSHITGLGFGIRWPQVRGLEFCRTAKLAGHPTGRSGLFATQQPKEDPR